jgi:threonyl-tRNA synthetase
VPYLLVVGDREMESGEVAVRTRDGQDEGALTISALQDKLGTEVARRG